ncbi:MAG: TIGR03667 family PPOX class F420-dependent oxidoreductase [Anaerolineales bacterium]|nr:TIGR03667 family PPOX class F420-dependent oxidoreductase [Anaerolineales bacterium]
MIELKGEYGERVHRRLLQEQVIWLTTIGPDHTPHPRPLWFYWDGQQFLLYSRPGAHKLKHIEQNPNVALHFNSDFRGHNVAVFLGQAEVGPKDRSAPHSAAYIDKYRTRIAEQGGTPESFSNDFSVSIHVEPDKLRGF